MSVVATALILGLTVVVLIKWKSQYAAKAKSRFESKA